MKKRSLFVVLGVVVALICEPTMAQDYGTEMGQSFINAIVNKDERGQWKPVAYPTDNFGIATLYDGKGAGSFLCATANCLSVPDNKTETLKNAGFIDSGSGGSVALSVTQKNSLGVNTALKIFALVGLSGKFDRSKNTVTNIQVPSATLRKLLKGKLTDQIKLKPPTSAVTDALSNRRLRGIAEDIVVESFTATLNLDATTAADIKAKLDANVGKVLAKDDSFGFTYLKVANGTYEVKATRPVIVAVAPVQQKKVGVLSGTNSDWIPDVAIRLKTDPPASAKKTTAPGKAK